MNDSRSIRVRFPPSPTGHMHLGSARTGLYNYLLAKKLGGKFILRIEDTDRKRFVPGAEQELVDGLHWLGMEWDEGPDIGGAYGPYRQSERKEIYQQYARELVENGKAYYCFCSPQRLSDLRLEQQKNKESIHYDGTCRSLSLAEADARIANGESHVVRFKGSRVGSTTMTDLLRGEITVENSAIDDFILVKSDGLALYHLATMVDDHLMEISHVIRGSEWLSTLPLHAKIYRAFGWQEPVWVHLSIFLKPSGKGKMSKREVMEFKDAGHSIFIKDLEEMGYLPDAVNNWIALMGWSFDDHTEFFRMADLIEKFSLERLNPKPAAINFTKLDYFNGEHIRAMNEADLAKAIKPYFVKEKIVVQDDLLLRIVPLIRVRLVTLDDAVAFAGFFFRAEVSPVVEDLVPKGMTAQQSLEIARKCCDVLNRLPDMRLDTTEPPMRELVEQTGLKPGQVFGILRVAVTGQVVSPPLFESMEIIGKETVMKRLQGAIRLLEDRAAQEAG